MSPREPSTCRTEPAAVRTIDAFKKRLGEKTTEQFEIFVDYMEVVRLSSQAHRERTVHYLSGKYAEAPPDVLITLGRAALPFMAKYREAIAPNVPIILASVPSTDAKASDLQNVFWVTTEYSFSKTLDLAERLQPGARNLVIVGGASDYDRQYGPEEFSSIPAGGTRPGLPAGRQHARGTAAARIRKSGGAPARVGRAVHDRGVWQRQGVAARNIRSKRLDHTASAGSNAATGELFARPQHAYTRQLLAAVPGAKRVGM